MMDFHRHLRSLRGCLAASGSALALLIVCCLAACQQQVRPAPATPVPAVSPTPAGALELATDPCASQVQDIAGALSIYFHDHKELPPTLDALKPAAARFGMNLNFTCPVSGKPYVYVPTGLAVPGQERVLVLYDAEPSHQGTRWGIVLSPPNPSIPDAPVTAEVVRLTQPVFDAYLHQGIVTQP